MSINYKILIFFIWLAVVSVSSFALFQVSFQVEELEKKIKVQDKKIAKLEQEQVVLYAEWAYMSRPERVSQLSQALLPQIKPYTTQQYKAVNYIPNRQILPPTKKTIMVQYNSAN